MGASNSKATYNSLENPDSRWQDMSRAFGKLGVVDNTNIKRDVIEFFNEGLGKQLFNDAIPPKSEISVISNEQERIRGHVQNLLQSNTNQEVRKCALDVIETNCEAIGLGEGDVKILKQNCLREPSAQASHVESSAVMASAIGKQRK